MKERKRILTILGGVLNILVGVFALILFGMLIVASLGISGTSTGWETLGLLFILPILIILIIVALGFAIAMVVVGAMQIRLGLYKNIEYSARTGTVIGFSIFEGVLVFILFISTMIFVQAMEIRAILITATIMILVSFILKIIDLIIFNSYVKKGKIILNKNTDIDVSKKANVNLENLNKINFDNIKNLDDANKSTEENVVVDADVKVDTETKTNLEIKTVVENETKTENEATTKEKVEAKKISKTNDENKKIVKIEDKKEKMEKAEKSEKAGNNNKAEIVKKEKSKKTNK